MSPKAVFGAMLAFCIALGVIRSNDSVVGGKKKIELSFWNGWTGPDGAAMLKIIRQFNIENPDIDVSMQRIEWATFYNKLMVAELNKRGPELFVVHASTLPRMFRAGFISDVSDLFKGVNGIPESDFDPYVLNEVKFGEKRVGLPLDIHPQGLYGNVDQLKQAGLVNSKGDARLPATRDEFVRAVHEMMVTSKGDSTPSIWGYSMTSWRFNFMTLVAQFDGHYFSKDGRADIANPGNVAALTFLANLAKNKLVPPPENQLGWVGFRQKKVSMVIDGVYMLGDLLRLDDLKYIGGPVPVIGNHAGTLADSHVLCIKTELPADKRDACERFIRYLSAHSIEWAAAGQVPARKSVRNTPEFRKMQVQYAFSKQIPTMQYPPRSTVLFELQFELDHATEMAVRGDETPLKALQAATINVQKVLDREKRDMGKGDAS
jgi:multiple sugar transport system substrate-binding protein